MKLTPGIVIVAGMLAAGAPATEDLERWLHNPRERTADGLRAYENGEPTAVGYMDGALRLTGEQALAEFNAGTARLAHGGEHASRLLARALEHAPPELVPAVAYNLGNALHEAGDLGGAIEAFKVTLRAEPSHLDAKHNLELALAELERQPPPQAEDPEQEEQDQGEEQSSDSGRPQEEEGSVAEPQPDQAGEDLRFETQPDMTAEQAAAILRAVENLEREQRRREAAERQRRQRRGEHDW